jgi:putative addiction module component (TIGR02574 family)
MSETAEELLRKALSLDEKDRASLAGALVESLHGEPESGAGPAWEDEIRRRVAELEAHTVATVPWSKVRERLFRGFERDGIQTPFSMLSPREIGTPTEVLSPLEDFFSR